MSASKEFPTSYLSQSKIISYSISELISGAEYKLCAQIQKYQEQGELLDPNLEDIVKALSDFIYGQIRKLSSHSNTTAICISLTRYIFPDADPTAGTDTDLKLVNRVFKVNTLSCGGRKKCKGRK